MEVLESILYPLVNELRESTPSSGPSSDVSPNMPLLGPSATWDSLDLVSFIIAVEERIEKQTGKRITLVSEAALSRTRSPFRTLGTLAEYIEEIYRTDPA